MIAGLIRWSLGNRFLVLLATLLLAAWGVYAVSKTPLDALPDLSDVQVIIRTPYPGQAPRIVEDQVTYPLTTTMLSVPGAKTVRGYSFFGDSFVYVLFEDGTDLYWARSRVLEYLNQMQGRLPAAAKPALGPDRHRRRLDLPVRAGGQGRHAGHFATARAAGLVPEVRTQDRARRAEVASVGGMVRQYQVQLDPRRLAAYGIPHTRVVEAIQKANQEAGGSVLELGEAEYMVRASGYLRSLEDFRQIPLTNQQRRHRRAPGRRGARAAGAGDAPRHWRAGRRRRGGGRHHRHALGQERAADHRRREGQAQGPAGQPAARCRDRAHLRPLGSDRARGGQPGSQAAGRVRRGGAGVPGLPVSPALGAGGHRPRCRWGCWRPSSSCITRASTPTSCRWAALPSPSAPWWTPPW